VQVRQYVLDYANLADLESKETRVFENTDITVVTMMDNTTSRKQVVHNAHWIIFRFLWAAWGFSVSTSLSTEPPLL